MINQDFAEYPEHRVGFFKLLRAINLNCFPGERSDVNYIPVYKLVISAPWHPPKSIQTVYGQYYMGHQAHYAGYCRNRSKLYVASAFSGVPTHTFLWKVCLEVINNFASATEVAVSNAFFQQYFLSIVQDIFFVLTDADHKSGFKLQSALLARLFQLVETNHIQAPLYDPSQVPDPNMSNSIFLREFCANLLKTAFPHVQPYVIPASS